MAVDWTRGLESQRFVYMLVDPATWQDTAELTQVKSASITWDVSADTLVSASIEADGELPRGEQIVRIYHEASQGKNRSRDCVATLVAQSPKWDLDSHVGSYKMDCFGTMLDLKDDMPPIGFSVAKGTDPLQTAATIAKAHMRAPVVMPADAPVTEEPWVAEDSDTWLSTVRALAELGGAQIIMDAFGRLRFEPKKRFATAAATRAFDDGNSSILMPSVSVEPNMYGVPNVVEVVFSENGKSVSAEAVDNDDSRETSFASRGRRVLKRIVNPDELQAGTTQAGCLAVAQARLSELIHRDQTVSFVHALMFPIPELGECVRLNYTKYGIDVSAQVTKQRMTCETGATVSTTATWRT